MWLGALLSTVHVLSLAGGVTSLFLRARALEGPLDRAGVERVLRIDNASGVIALTWMGSGLWRLLGGVEKGTSFYTENPVFWAKMALLTAAWLFELRPMLTFIKWRGQLARGEAIDTSVAPRLRAHHGPELACVVLTTLLASLMARGVGRPTGPSSAELAAGEAVYRARCAACHQADGRGLGGRLAADFVGDRARLAKPDDALLRAIERGVPGTAMRGFGGETSLAERRAVLAYLRATFGAR